GLSTALTQGQQFALKSLMFPATEDRQPAPAQEHSGHGLRRTHEGQARPRHGRGEQPFHRLGHCAGAARCRCRTGFLLPGRSVQEARGAAGEPLKPAALIDCDVSNQGSIDGAFAELARKWDSLDFVVHAIAFSDKEQLKGRYVDTTPENFRMTMDISCYSFTAVAQRAEKMMTKGGAMVTLTYYGAEKVMPHYNVMGVAKAALEASVRYMAEDLGKKNIRVNAISAGPI